ncbi:type II toxin-antitoxin system MqsA family antitoxin [Fibrisoma limi]|uniref:type II toxin-antitoxin system MqsA family antitoxin n=1 Tax=Fibrisoma limi TaxID=663275 RepID=UPI0005867CCE|nr:type II toxin-antitoxin system MqsA family antitoxin [Fibrisoma limi]
MICLTCKMGTPEPGLTTVTLERNGAIVVFKDVPAQICDNCGEKYFDADITRRLLTQVEDAVARGAEVEVVRLQAA